LNDFWIDLGLTQKDISISMQTIESFNIKKIDSTTPRRSFVRDPVELELNKLEKDSIKLKIANHPEGSVEGYREWKIDNQNRTICIERNDLDKKIRLKDFASVVIKNNKAIIESTEIIDKRPIVHWIIKNNSREAILYVPDKEEIFIHKGIIEKENISEGTVYQLERVGFVKIEKVPSEGPVEMVWLHN